jgi:hypothetical protein
MIKQCDPQQIQQHCRAVSQWTARLRLVGSSDAQRHPAMVESSGHWDRRAQYWTTCDASIMVSHHTMYVRASDSQSEAHVLRLAGRVVYSSSGFTST